MTDLEKRLREDYGINPDWPVSAKIVVIDMNRERYQSADRIAELERELGRLCAGIRNIADCRETVPFGENPLDFCIDQARALTTTKAPHNPETGAG